MILTFATEGLVRFAYWFSRAVRVAALETAFCSAGVKALNAARAASMAAPLDVVAEPILAICAATASAAADLVRVRVYLPSLYTDNMYVLPAVRLADTEEVYLPSVSL